MSVFTTPVSLIATGLALTAGTVAVAGPLLYLAAPVATNRGRQRLGAKVVRQVYRRGIQRRDPGERHPEVNT